MTHESARKVLALVNRHDLAFCDFDADGDGAPDPFFNANRPEDLAEAESYLAATKATHGASGGIFSA